MKNTLKYHTICFVALLLGSCTQQQEITFNQTDIGSINGAISIVETSLNIPAAGGNGYVVVESKEALSATVDELWCTVSVNSKRISFSAEALELCGERPTDEEIRDGAKRALVFWDFRRCMIQYPLRDWLKASGIKKHITFHCFRHTFATLQIALGTDIYTVSKMLTHRNVATTQIYADLVSSKKRESANKISLR